MAAGEDWDDVVAATVAEGLAGLERLSGIPGRAGATPIQNVGAYGQEVAEVITRCGCTTGRRQPVPIIATSGAVRLPHQPVQEAARPPALSPPGRPRRPRLSRYVVLEVTFGLHAEPLSRR